MTLKIRLYFSDKIQSDLVSHLTKEQSHYVKDVMRLEKGDYLSVFNAQGEWNAIIENYEKEGARIKILRKVRDRDNEKNIWLAFSPIKQNPLNFIIQKGTELGVQKFLPKIKLGDKRVFVIGGVIKGVIKRVPKRGSIISNIGQGGIPKKTTLTRQELKITKIVAKNLKKNKIVFAGIDLIAGYLTGDINITSPTGLKNYKDISGVNLAVDFWNYLEN